MPRPSYCLRSWIKGSVAEIPHNHDRQRRVGFWRFPKNSYIVKMSGFERMMVLLKSASLKKCEPHLTLCVLLSKMCFTTKYLDVTQWVRKTQGEMSRLRLEWDKNKICIVTLWGFPQQLQCVPFKRGSGDRCRVTCGLSDNDSNSACIIQNSVLKNMIHFCVLTSQITVGLIDITYWTLHNSDWAILT